MFKLLLFSLLLLTELNTRDDYTTPPEGSDSQVEHKNRYQFALIRLLDKSRPALVRSLTSDYVS